MHHARKPSRVPTSTSVLASIVPASLDTVGTNMRINDAIYFYGQIVTYIEMQLCNVMLQFKSVRIQQQSTSFYLNSL